MCGIVGVIGKNWKTTLGVKAENIFKQMLFCNTLRGDDGTGLFLVDTSFKIRADKHPDAAPYAMTLLNKLATDTYKSIIAIGHNRKSTMGAHTIENTHPFTEGNITLVHNGTLTNHTEIGSKKVDSHCIAEALSKKETAKTVLESLEGAYALIWWDDKRKQLLIARNSERPLTIVETAEFYVISSEIGLSKWICERNDTKIIKEFVFEIGYLYRVFTDKNGKLRFNKEKFTIKKSKPKQNNWLEYYKSNSKVYTPTTTPVKASDRDKLIKEYVGKTIDFFPKKFTVYGQAVNGESTNVRLEGVLEENPFVEVVCWIKNRDHQLFSGCKKLTAYVDSVTFHDELMLKNVTFHIPKPDTYTEPEPEYITAAGEVLTELDVENLQGHTCSLCGSKFDEFDLEDSYVFITPKTAILDGVETTYGKDYEYFCPKCVWADNHTGSSVSQKYG